ncbi:DUF1439 domain-containing protein [Massilia sp. YIM B02763]|uniref:DUF1439 domain-containing protein n=1 Tax=Massilia sp. YIM B02763 TaxID=3050130 RepID=UPI0025B648B0|nr:DUF1439 domain-containing protein [Massilia sp. YIM B02763]MDN4053491.1 DUF1439 domain-containing protein [Massilia sp. YIM B02763]
MKGASKEFTRRDFGKAAGALAVAGLLASCASIVGPRRVELSQSRLQAGLERRFPLNNRLLELFDVRLTHPRVTIQPETDRVALTLDVSVAPPFVRQSWNGTLAVSGHLVLDAPRNAVFMQDTHVDRFEIANMEGGRARDLERAADLLVNQLVRDLPVYSFRPEDLRYAGVQFVPTRLETAPGALFVTLEPVR